MSYTLKYCPDMSSNRIITETHTQHYKISNFKNYKKKQNYKFAHKAESYSEFLNLMKISRGNDKMSS